MSWIFPRADREGRICFLCASPVGYGLYRKLGFEEVGGPGSIVEVDRSEWGGSGVHRHIAMVRYPVGWAAGWGESDCLGKAHGAKGRIRRELDSGRVEGFNDELHYWHEGPQDQ